MAESQGRGAEMLFAMRLLAVFVKEKAAYEIGGEWAILSGLVAANEPRSVDVHVLALITPTKPSFWFGNPLGRALAGSGGGAAPPARPHAAGGAPRPPRPPPPRLSPPLPRRPPAPAR